MIVLAGGDYHLVRPVTFDSRDKGLVVTAACDAKPVLYGGPRITGWAQRPDGLWTASLVLPADRQLGDLFVDGIRQTRARFPNAPLDADPRKGWLFAARCEPPMDPWKGNSQFCFHKDDLLGTWNLAGASVNVVGGFLPGTQWGSDTLPIVSVDAANRTIHTKGTAYFYTSEGSRYFLEGLRAFLDAPTEWWHDPQSHQLEYIAGQLPPSSSMVVAGILPTFMELSGAEGMTVSGLHFRDGAPYGTGKLHTDSRGFGAIRVNQAHNVRLVGNTLQNVGVGIHVNESTNVLIAGNVIRDVAGNGIYVGTTFGRFGRSDRAKILSNHIANVGRVYFESAGIWFQAADDVRIAYNLIEKAAQFAIAGGSLWGPEDSVHNAVIEYNVIRNANQQTGDGGAIKFMGQQADLLRSVIRYNLVVGTGHLMNRPDGTFWPPGYEKVEEWPGPISWAIYTDGRASGVRIEGNVLWSNVSAIGINGGWNNVVTANIIYGGTGAAFRIDDATGRDWHPIWARANQIGNNFVFLDRDKPLVTYFHAPGHGREYVRFANNRYVGHLNEHSFRFHPPIMLSGESGSLADLQQAGGDLGSVAIRP